MLVKLTKDEGNTKVLRPIVSQGQIRIFNQSNDPFFKNTFQIRRKLSGIVRLQMKTLFSSLFLLLFLSVSALGQGEPINSAFTFGEELQFDVSYGWINLAEAKLQIHRRVVNENSRPHYKIDAFGKTKGAATIFGRVNDNWGTHVDTSTLLPSLSYRYIEEGKYRKNEKVFFDQQNKKAKMELYDRENRNLKESKEYKLPGQVQDLVSGFYYLRTMDLTNLKKGQSILITGFFDKEIYNLKLIYDGKEKLSTQVGDFDTFKFTPIMPSNKLFRGEHPVTIWVSDDQNKIPLKIKAKLMVGALNMDITKATGLRNN